MQTIRPKRIIFNETMAFISGAQLEGRGGSGEVSPTVFRQLEKSSPIWEKVTLVVVTYE